MHEIRLVYVQINIVGQVSSNDLWNKINIQYSKYFDRIKLLWNKLLFKFNLILGEIN